MIRRLPIWAALPLLRGAVVFWLLLSRAGLFLASPPRDARQDTLAQRQTPHPLTPATNPVARSTAPATVVAAPPAWATPGTAENQAFIAACPQFSNRTFLTSASLHAQIEVKRQEMQRWEALHAARRIVELSEVELWTHSTKLRTGMTAEAVVRLMGPTFSTSGPVRIPVSLLPPGTKSPDGWFERGNFEMLYTPHPKRSWHKIGDTFQVLTVYFGTNNLSRTWEWFYPDRN